jgi:hypothetical protein
VSTSGVCNGSRGVGPRRVPLAPSGQTPMASVSAARLFVLKCDAASALQRSLGGASCRADSSAWRTCHAVAASISSSPNRQV